MRAVVVLGLIAALAGRADADDPAVAKRLFSEGRVLYDQGKFIEACVLFEKSFELDPAVGTKLNLAECAERDNKPRAAWLLWVSAADEFEKRADKRGKFARSRADALGPKLGTVVVTLAKPNQRGLTVEIAGRTIKPALVIVDRLDPGEIKVVVHAPGRESFETTVTVALGGKTTVEVPALAMVSGPEPDEEPDPPPEPLEQPIEKPAPVAPSRNWWKIGALTGGALTVLSAATYIFAVQQIKRVEDEVSDAQTEPNPDLGRIRKLNDEGFAWETRGKTALGVTLALAAVTTVFVFKSRSFERSKRTALVTPVIGRQVAGAQLQVSW